MVEVKDLRGWSLLPGWIQSECLAEIRSMLDQQGDHLGDAAEVITIVYDAEQSHVDMVVRIIPAPTTVRLDICHNKK